MKNILIAVDTYYPKKDGVVRFLENIMEGLAKNNKVVVMAPKFEGEVPQVKNVEVIRLPVSQTRKFAGYNAVIWDAHAKNTMKKCVKNADIIFSQDVALLGRKAIAYGKKYKKPVICYVHQIIWEQFTDIATKHIILKKILISTVRYLTKMFYKKCNALFVPSVTVSEQLKNENVNTEKVLIPLGIDIGKFKPPKNKNTAKINAGIDPNKFVIGYCGRISKEKDLETLEEAFKEIKKDHKEAFLLIIGGGDAEETEELKKIGKVTGFVKDVVPYLQALDVFVLPSLTETTSLATMEAMACGVPAITTPSGRLKEYVKNGINGYLFPKRGVESLIRRLEEVISDNNKLNILSRNARAAMINLRWESTVQKMENFFAKL